MEVRREEEADAELAQTYRIRPHGRYTHGLAYVERLLVSVGLTPRIGRADLRLEAGLPVAGLVVCGIKPGDSAAPGAADSAPVVACTMIGCEDWTAVATAAFESDGASASTLIERRPRAGTTFVVVTHELPSIFELGDRAVFLDAEKKTMTAQGAPKELKESPDPKVRAFLSRGRV